jgi:hypothetical protein
LLAQPAKNNTKSNPIPFRPWSLNSVIIFMNSSVVFDSI